MIDILLSTYNGQKYIREQIDSIINQSFKDWNLIIRDDGSKDDTLKILNEYCSLFPNRIKLLNDNENLGSSNSFIELLKNSTSELIMFCDQDDTWNQNKLELFYDFYQNNCNKINTPILIHSYACVVNSDLKLMSAETESFNNRKKGMENSLVWHIFQNDVTGCTVMINNKMKDLFNHYDYKENKIIQHDWLLSQIAYLYKTKYLLKEQTIQYRQHANNVLGAKSLSIVDRIKLKIQKGVKYDYYDQIKTLLKLVSLEDEEVKSLLVDYSELKNRNKIYRCLWHIKHHFRREGNFLYFIYQLFSC